MWNWPQTRKDGSHVLETRWHSLVECLGHFFWNGAVHSFLQSLIQLSVHLQTPSTKVHLKLISYLLVWETVLRIPTLHLLWGWLNLWMKFLCSAEVHKIMKQKASQPQVISMISITRWGAYVCCIHIQLCFNVRNINNVLWFIVCLMQGVMAASLCCYSCISLFAHFHTLLVISPCINVTASVNAFLGTKLDVLNCIPKYDSHCAWTALPWASTHRCLHEKVLKWFLYPPMDGQVSQLSQPHILWLLKHLG